MADQPIEVSLTEIDTFMESYGYRWSNEAQVYYHRGYELPVFSSYQARLAYLKWHQVEEQ